jgi:LacI family transcriptional regulator
MNVKRTTISDVAKEAGTSIATVSRVLNNTNYPVRSELREKILKTANMLNYTPNFFGKSLKSGKSNDIGVVVPSLINPFYSEVIAGIEKACRKDGYNPIFCSSGNKPIKEKEFIDLLQQKYVEGILISTINEDSDYIKQLISCNTNIVFFDQQIPDFNGDSVTFDFYQAGMLSAQHLLEKGHQDIAFLSAPFERFSRRAIYKGFKEALLNAGTPFNETNLFISSMEDDVSVVGSDEFENGRKLARIFLDAHCSATAIVTINDITAFGIIQELIKNGHRIPEDISVIGFDNINLSAMINPPLTTVSQPSFEMGILAAKVLIDRIERQNKISTQISLKPAIVERESVKTLNHVD